MTATGDSNRPSNPIEVITIQDGRQSPRATEIARGAARLLAQYDRRCIPELGLPDGRRADLMALGAKGELWIVEIKSSLEDFRSDTKWPEYRAFCDRLLFAVGRNFPIEVLPPDAGLLVCDRYGGELVREAPLHEMPTARRKALLLRFARVAAGRLMALADPEAGREALVRE